MHCYICDGPCDEPKIDQRDGKIRPCSTCEAVISDILLDYDEDFVFVYLDEELKVEV